MLTTNTRTPFYTELWVKLNHVTPLLFTPIYQTCAKLEKPDPKLLICVYESGIQEWVLAGNIATRYAQSLTVTGLTLLLKSTINVAHLTSTMRPCSLLSVS